MKPKRSICRPSGTARWTKCARYEAVGAEDFEADDDYQQWQWFADAIATVRAQLNAVSELTSL